MRAPMPRATRPVVHACPKGTVKIAKKASAPLRCPFSAGCLMNSCWSFLGALDDPQSLAMWAQTSRCHHDLANDPLLWRRLCELRFGPLLHRHFARWNKSWHWLYRAQSHEAAPTVPMSAPFSCKCAIINISIGATAAMVSPTATGWRFKCPRANATDRADSQGHGPTSTTQ
ncbi:F-box incomplete domain containing protein [Pandoravirus salinus]|uniref:F-box incomplete domain containing protein n=1 Tax=Pandoravirus salinus TaxID=1349410 RepID=S4VZE5_9VIRU|nr:F-box incomplete domain [Pandoravirus salinus]AGO84881.1 F-box incomplete domain containing protein [Pandoravirus salinus]